MILPVIARRTWAAARPKQRDSYAFAAGQLEGRCQDLLADTDAAVPVLPLRLFAIREVALVRRYDGKLCSRHCLLLLGRYGCEQQCGATEFKCSPSSRVAPGAQVLSSTPVSSASCLRNLSFANESLVHGAR